MHIENQQGLNHVALAWDGTPFVASQNMMLTTRQPEEIFAAEDRLADLQREHPVGEKGFTKAGIRKLIASLNEELAIFEGSEEARAASSGRVASVP